MNKFCLVEVNNWEHHLEQLDQRLDQHFARPELRQRTRQYLRGLLSDVPRKNGWQLAEHVGDLNPYGVQRLLGRARWDAEIVRDDLISYVLQHLHDPNAILVIDETGFLKKGKHSVGVQRQYSGTAGRIENCQIGVFLAYATEHTQVFLDRQLYLPKEWAQDADRREKAGVPQDIRFATKPEIARNLLERAFAAGVQATWVTADEVYGSDSRLRVWLEDRSQRYVMSVRSGQHVWQGWRQRTVKTIANQIESENWHQLSCGKGAKGPRVYAWAWIRVNCPEPETFSRWLLIRRNIETAEMAYYICGGPPQTTLEEVVAVAGRRWSVEIGFEAAKQEAGLDEYEVRSWTGWYRHITLCLFAHAFLSVCQVQAMPKTSETRSPKKSGKSFP